VRRIGQTKSRHDVWYGETNSYVTMFASVACDRAIAGPSVHQDNVDACLHSSDPTRLSIIHRRATDIDAIPAVTSLPGIHEPNPPPAPSRASLALTIPFGLSQLVILLRPSSDRPTWDSSRTIKLCSARRPRDLQAYVRSERTCVHGVLGSPGPKSKGLWRGQRDDVHGLAVPARLSPGELGRPTETYRDAQRKLRRWRSRSVRERSGHHWTQGRGREDMDG
jgi:hypothetical protein